MDKQLVISLKTIVITLLLIVGAYVVYRLGPIIGILMISTLIVLSMENAIKKLSVIPVLNKPMGRTISVLICYALLILSIILIITTGMPPVINQFQKLLSSLTDVAVKFHITDKVSFSLSDLLPSASQFSSGVISITISILSNITTFISILIIAVYMSFDWENLKRGFISLFPDRLESDVSDVVKDVENNIGQWVKGELFLMLIIGIMSFIGLTILDIKYALALSIIAGLLEAVPTLGPIITAIITAIVGFSASPVKGIGTIALGIIIHQSENAFLVPVIMKKVSGFSPLIILISLLIGGEFFGILGAVLAIPVTMILYTVLRRTLSIWQD